MPDVLEKVSPFAEIGVTGLQVQAGRLDDEWLLRLKDRNRRYKEFRVMLDYPVIRSSFQDIELAIRQVTWRVDPADESAQAQELAEFVETCLQDMSTGWADLLADILSFLPWGFAFHEQVYKKRAGEVRNQPGASSVYTDGKIGWRKWPIRAQESLDEWIFDSDGGIKAVKQEDPETRDTYTIPIEKALLFRTSVHKGNPEGRAMLRGVYQAYYYAKKMEGIEAVGFERDLGGLPVFTVPASLYQAGTTGSQATQRRAYEDAVVNIRRGEQDGMVLPVTYDAQGNPSVKLELLSSPSRRQYDSDVLIKRHLTHIRQGLLSDVMELGTDKVGSFALSKTKRGMRNTALGSWLDMIADVINRHAIPRLMNLNGDPLELAPTLVHDDIEAAELDLLAKYIDLGAASGILIPTEDDEKWYRDQAGMPELDEALRAAALAEQERQRQEMQQGFGNQPGDGNGVADARSGSDN